VARQERRRRKDAESTAQWVSHAPVCKVPSVALGNEPSSSYSPPASEDGSRWCVRSPLVRVLAVRKLGSCFFPVGMFSRSHATTTCNTLQVVKGVAQCMPAAGTQHAGGLRCRSPHESLCLQMLARMLVGKLLPWRKTVSSTSQGDGMQMCRPVWNKQDLVGAARPAWSLCCYRKPIEHLCCPACRAAWQSNQAERVS
jgi:hypothetical protein